MVAIFLIQTHSYLRLIYNKTIFWTNIMNQEENNPCHFMDIQEDNGSSGYVQGDRALQNQVLEDQIIFKLIRNDRKQQNMKFLLDLKSIIVKQLPNMQKQQIVRLVFDYNHQSIIILKNNTQVLGGICFREFKNQKFAEIAFLAITSAEQVKGFGKKLMNKLKEQVQRRKVQYLLTYADNLALRYFKKQGFSQTFRMLPERWEGHIKHYEGGTLMECYVHPTIKYSQIDEIIKRQKEFVMKKIKERAITKYQLDAWTLLKIKKEQPFTRMNGLGEIETFKINPLDIPGVVESGWTWQQHQQILKQKINSFNEEAKNILVLLKNNQSSQPFRNPVSLKEVPDYRRIVKEPMDLQTIEIKLNRNQYRDIDDFFKDIDKIFKNCRVYNKPQSIYCRCAAQLQKYSKIIYKNYKQGRLNYMLPTNKAKRAQLKKQKIKQDQLKRY